MEILKITIAFFPWGSNQRWGTWKIREYQVTTALLWLHSKCQVIRNAALDARGEGRDFILEARCVLSTIDAVKHR